MSGPRTAPMTNKHQRQRVWQSMRRLRQFSIDDLVAVAEASKQNTRLYVRELAREGYLEQLYRRVGWPRGTGIAVWRLRKDTGPVAPRVRRRHRADL